PHLLGLGPRRSPPPMHSHITSPYYRFLSDVGLSGAFVRATPIVRHCSLLPRCQMSTRLSRPALARGLPSLDRAMSVTWSVWPLRLPAGLPVVASHRFTPGSLPPV